MMSEVGDGHGHVVNVAAHSPAGPVICELAFAHCVSRAEKLSTETWDQCLYAVSFSPNAPN